MNCVVSMNTSLRDLQLITKRKVLLKGGPLSRTAKAGCNPERSPLCQGIQQPGPRPQLHAQHLRWGISSYMSYSCKEAVTIIPTALRTSSISYYPKSFPKWWKGWQGLAFRQPAQFSPAPPPPPFFFLRYRHLSFASTGWDAAIGHRKLKVKKEHKDILWHADTIYHIKWFMWAICSRGKLS